MELSIQETVETTKALLRLIQLMSLHPITAVIFSNCSAQEPHGMDMHTADSAAAPPLAGDCWGYCLLLLPRGRAKGCLGGTRELWRWASRHGCVCDSSPDEGLSKEMEFEC